MTVALWAQSNRGPRSYWHTSPRERSFVNSRRAHDGSASRISYLRLNENKGISSSCSQQLIQTHCQSQRRPPEQHFTPFRNWPRRTPSPYDSNFTENPCCGDTRSDPSPGRESASVFTCRVVWCAARPAQCTRTEHR